MYVSKLPNHTYKSSEKIQKPQHLINAKFAAFEETFLKWQQKKRRTSQIEAMPNTLYQGTVNFCPPAKSLLPPDLEITSISRVKATLSTYMETSMTSTSILGCGRKGHLITWLA